MLAEEYSIFMQSKQSVQLCSSDNNLQQNLHFIWKTLITAQYQKACYGQLNDCEKTILLLKTLLYTSKYRFLQQY